jgi:hypothetical protein
MRATKNVYGPVRVSKHGDALRYASCIMIIRSVSSFNAHAYSHLYEVGTDINTPNEDNHRPLHLAVFLSHCDIIRYAIGTAFCWNLTPALLCIVSSVNLRQILLPQASEL